MKRQGKGGNIRSALHTVQSHGGDALWTKDPGVLWRRPREFFPGPDMSIEERCNACVRFVWYAVLVIVLWRMSTEAPVVPIMVAGMAAVALLTGFSGETTYPNSPTFAAGNRRCKLPTADNPFGNVLPGQDPFGMPPCGYADGPEAVRRVREKLNEVAPHVAEDRQFATAAVYNNIPDTGKFIDFVYGHRPTCKESTVHCTPRQGARPPGR